MAQQVINTGTAPNDGTGDTVKTSFTKANANFTELYGAVAAIPATLLLPPQGRLTLQSATPVMTTTQSAKTTIYYTPYRGDTLPLFNGSAMAMTQFSELSVATTDTSKNPAAIGASKVNDWFVWLDGSTLRISHGPDWTNDTTRSAGTALINVRGILLNNAAITNGPAASRGTYVGTTRSNSSSQLSWIYGGVALNGTAGFFGVWNCYNRVRVASMCGDNTDSWTYNSDVVRAANASNTMRHSFVSGLAEDAFEANYSLWAQGSIAGSLLAAICYDVTNAFSGRRSPKYGSSEPSTVGGDHATTALGFHFFQAGEIASTLNTGTFFGSWSSGGMPHQSGMTFRGWM